MISKLESICIVAVFFSSNFLTLYLENLDGYSNASIHQINEKYVKFIDVTAGSDDPLDEDLKDIDDDFLGDDRRSNDLNILVDSLEYDDYEDYDIEFIRRYSVAAISDRANNYDKEDKQQFKDFHNMYRSNQSVKTIPYFRDMEYIEWDNVMEWQAELWVDLCIMYQHGRPKEENSTYSQNLYFGPIHSPSRAMFLWYYEHNFYNFTSLKCALKVTTASVTCGHFTTMMWAKSNKVGCARQLCEPRINKFIVACHYIPEGNIFGYLPFIPGKPCNRCFGTRTGLCSNNLCVNQRMCDAYNLNCTCDIVCENCAVFDKPNCRCICPDGWDGADCGSVCENHMPTCLDKVKKGAPLRKLCAYMNYVVKLEYCRKLCGACKVADPEKSYALCCDGVSCEEGYSLNETDCTCIIDCPGPLCPLQATLQPYRMTPLPAPKSSSSVLTALHEYPIYLFLLGFYICSAYIMFTNT